MIPPVTHGWIGGLGPGTRSLAQRGLAAIIPGRAATTLALRSGEKESAVPGTRDSAPPWKQVAR
jgi:hypothetical protein